MSILVVSESYWPHGGAELAFHCVLRMLRDEGFDITVLTGARKIEPLKRVKYLYMPFLNVQNKIWLWANLTTHGSFFKKIIRQNDILYVPRLAYPLIPIARKSNKKTIVHIFDLQPVSYEASVYFPYKNRNIFSEMRRTFIDERLEYSSITRSILCSFLTPTNFFVTSWLREADVIICESERQKEIITQKLPFTSCKTKVIYDPLPDVPFILKKLDNPTFLYLGGDIPGKGINTLIKASMNLLYSHYKDNIRFIMTKITKKKNRMLLNKLNRKINENYAVLGEVPHNEVLMLHSKCISLIMPTLWEEPLPTVMLESMLAGTIPIASSAGGNPEIVKGTFAEKMLFTPGNADELVQRMELIMSLSVDQISQVGISLRKNILERFDETVIKKQLLDVFS